MSKLVAKGNDAGTGTFTLESPAGNVDRTLALPDTNGELTANQGVAVASGNIVSHKVAIVIDGITYYLMASTSGA